MKKYIIASLKVDIVNEGVRCYAILIEAISCSNCNGCAIPLKSSFKKTAWFSIEIICFMKYFQYFTLTLYGLAFKLLREIIN